MSQSILNRGISRARRPGGGGGGGLGAAPSPGSLPDHMAHMPLGALMIDTPLYGQAPTHTLALTGGNWSDPAVWSTGTVPASSSDVQVQAGAAVTIDGTAAVARSVVVQGTLGRSRTASTRLTCVTLSVISGGTYEMGTPASPIPAAYTAEHVVADAAIDTTFDPERWGHGILVSGALHNDSSGNPIGPPGVLRMCGTDRTPTFVRLGAEAFAGDTVLTMGTSVLNRWRVGDGIELPDSRLLEYTERYAGNWPVVFQGEARTIASIAGDGLSVTLSSALTYDHLGGRKADGTWDTQPLYPHVANTTRNVRVYSETPAGVRGHCAFMHRADVDLRHAEFRDLGRTVNAALDSTTFDPTTGAITHVGTNQIGRYPVHFHHCWGPAGGVASASGFPISSPRQNQGMVYGCLVRNPSQIAATMAARDTSAAAHWGLVTHMTGWTYQAFNVVTDYAGSCIVEESGYERENIIEDNYMSRCYGTGGRLDQGFEGVCYFARSADNRIRRNVATNYGGGDYCYGFLVLGDRLGLGNSPPGSLLLPLIPGVDMHYHTTADGTNTELVDTSAIPVREWHDNEAYAGVNGSVFWWLGWGVTAARGTAGTIQSQTAWHVQGWGVFVYHNSSLIFDDCRTYGDNFRIVAGVGKITTVPIGFQLSDYPMLNTVIRNSRLETVYQAVTAPVFCMDSTFTVRNVQATVTNCGMGISSFYPASGGAQLDGGRDILLDGCTFNYIDGSAYYAIRMGYVDNDASYDGKTGAQTYFQAGAFIPNNIALSTVRVVNHRGSTGVNFRVYCVQQAPSYVPMATVGGTNFVGSPEAGLTNQQLHDKYLPWSVPYTPTVKPGGPNSATPGTCVFGELLPAGTSTTAHADIYGLTLDG